MNDNEILLKLLEEVQAARADIQTLDAKIERRLNETEKVVHEVAETIIEKLTSEIKEVKSVTATNCYDIANLRRKA